jgi:ubiquinone/menaquinone biosynthesis C-methylase UbiE
MTTKQKVSLEEKMTPVGKPPEGAPQYAGPPMTLELWISKYFPTLQRIKQRIKFRLLEQMDGPFDATDLMPPGATQPAKYPAYFFMKPVHTFPTPGGLDPAFGPYHGEFQKKTTFYFTKPETIKYWLQQVYGDIKPQRAIDLGCGIGATTFVMAELWPDCEVIGIDLSPSNLRYARRLAEQQGVKNIFFYHMDAGDCSYFPDESFDVVNESYILHEMPTYHSRAVVKEMIRLAKPGSTITWFDWPPAESPGDLARREEIVKRGSEPCMLQYLDLRLEQYLVELGLEDVRRVVRAGANMLVAARKPARHPAETAERELVTAS